MELSVVIPCCGGAEDTRHCLEALHQQVDAPSFEVVVVDNGCTDDTAAMCATFPGVRVVTLPSNLGFAGGANAGLRAGRGRYLAVLNNDTMPAPRMLQHLHGVLATDPSIAAVGPVSNVVKGPARLAVGDRGETREGRIEIEDQLADTPPIQDVDTLSGLCLAMPRVLWEQTGGFDERFGAGNFEDDDLCLRLRLAGHRLVIARRAFVHHRGHRSFDALGLDYATQLQQRRQQFRDKWADVAAGAAWSAWLDGDRAAAERCAEQALAECPAWPDGLHILGVTAAARGDAARAAALLQRFVARCPTHSTSVAELVVQLVRAGQQAQAWSLLSSAVQTCWFTDDVAASMMLQLAVAMIEQKDPARALRFADDGLALQPEHGALHNVRGAALLQQQRPAPAAEAFRTAMAAGCPDAHANLGVAMWEMGDRAQALRVWQALLADDPHHASARAHLQRVADAVGGRGLAQPAVEPATADPARDS